MSSLTDSITLLVAPGVPETKIPRFGLGVYESEGEDCYNSVLWALEVGACTLLRYLLYVSLVKAYLIDVSFSYSGWIPLDRVCALPQSYGLICTKIA
jgi:hypothetical protein